MSAPSQTRTVLFCNPPWWTEQKEPSLHFCGDRFAPGGGRLFIADAGPGKWILGSECPYPYPLASAATYVRLKTGLRVRHRDCVARREDYPTFGREITRMAPDIVFLATCARSLAVKFQ